MENPVLAETFGSPKENYGAIVMPNRQVSAEEYNAHTLLSSQMSMTTAKVIIDFPTVASGDSTPTMTRTHWGMASGASSSLYPTSVTRTGTGLYVLTYASTMQNEYEEDETVSFSWSWPVIRSLTVTGKVQSTESGTVITVQTFNAAGATADLTAGTTIRVFAG